LSFGFGYERNADKGLDIQRVVKDRESGTSNAVFRPTITDRRIIDTPSSDFSRTPEQLVRK
jgi:hypothetical protein